jgi:hypothetical protein
MEGAPSGKAPKVNANALEKIVSKILKKITFC